MEMDNILRDDLISRKEAIKLIEDMLARPSIKENPDTANGLIGAHKIIWEMDSASPKFYPLCVDCNEKMDEIRRIYDKISSENNCAK